MASIGGLDLPYGSQAQIVRTNVLVVAVAAAGSPVGNVGVSLATAKATHSNMQKLPASIRPDFTTFCIAGDPDGVGYSTAAYTGLFDEDPDNDGTIETVRVDNGGLLRSLTEVPVMPGSATPSPSYATDSQVYTLGSEASRSYGDTSVALGAANLTGSMAIESVLSVGAVNLTNASGATTDDLFTESTSPANGIAGAAEGNPDQSSAMVLQSQVMENSYENFAANYLGSAGAVTVNGGKTFALDLTSVATDSAWAALTGVDTATAKTEFNANVESTTLDSWLAAGASGLGGSATIISVTTLCSKI